MPITPPQAFTMSGKEYEVLRVIENKIDEYLETNYYPGLTVTVNLPSGTVSDRMVKAIVGHYGQMGWTVEAKGRNQDSVILDFIPIAPMWGSHLETGGAAPRAGGGSGGGASSDGDFDFS